MSQVEHHKSGQGYWRGLEQLADGPEVRELLAQEFPGYDPAGMVGNPSRRRFLKLMGASMALAGLTLTGCRRWPKEKLAPYTSNPTHRIVGIPEHYATVWELGGVGQGLLVSSWDGRPIKIEGNPSHPFAWTVKDKQASADAWAQASVLEMYDPNRSRDVIDRRDGKATVRTWADFGEFATVHFGRMKGNGEGFAVLSEATSSPSVADMRRRLQAAFPKAKWYEYEPLTRDAEVEGARQAFGKAVRVNYDLQKADTVVSLDADLLGLHPAHIRYAADWSERRRQGARGAEGVKEEKGTMNRVYCAETCFSITGSVADVRVAVDPSRLAVVARELAARVGAGVQGSGEKLTAAEEAFVAGAAADLQKTPGAGVVAAGPAAPAAVHALAHAINQKIGAVGKTVTLLDDGTGDRPTHLAAITELAKGMAGGGVNTLLILGGNPAYDAPLDADFANALGKVPTTIRLGLYNDETSALCKWHLPRAHYLESWGDSRAWDGTASIQQPLIEPLFGGKSVVEVLAAVTNDQVRPGDQIVQRTWREQLIKGGNFEQQWRRALEAGVLANSAYPAAQVTLKGDAVAAAGGAQAATRPAGTFFLKFETDYRTYDGRFANNGWLQETHDPLTKLVWDNAAIVSVKDARDESIFPGGLKSGDVVKLTAPDGRWIEVAAYVLPGQPVGVIGLSLGYGRTAEDLKVGQRLGFNAYAMRKSEAAYAVPGVKAAKTGQTYALASTHLHHLIDALGMVGRDDRVGQKGKTGVIVREATLGEFKKDPTAPHERGVGKMTLQLFDKLKYDGPHAWGMAIDLNTCIGCNACVVACQAENNIPVVGKDQVMMHRQMHWLRIDRYFKTAYEPGHDDPVKAAEDPQVDVVYQPMLCVHCENAPCEQVCPVAATVHDTEGLNTMVYNRCIGTRYCSNNCPYKVRRFNYFDWHAKPPRKSTGNLWPGMPDTQQREQVDKFVRMQFNPEVSVRMRGVMEKCTYCTQRLQRAKIDKRNRQISEGKPEHASMVLGGEVLTACQQACPTQAIVFGNLRDTNAQVVTLQNSKRAFEPLGELNTQPRTKYLAKLRNPVNEGVGTPGAAPVEKKEPHAAAEAAGSVG